MASEKVSVVNVAASDVVALTVGPHLPRLSHNWEADAKKKAFVCSAESFLFSEASEANANCRGCSTMVPFSVYAEHAVRWSKSSSPLHWVVDKALNEVISPCPCRRCEMRRRRQPNYKGLTKEGIKAQDTE